MNKPMAWINRKGKDGEHGYLEWDKDDEAEINTPLYTHPVKERNNGGEPVKNATYWKRQYNLMASQNDNLKSGLYHANEQIKYLESHPVKELTEQAEKDIRHAVSCYFDDSTIYGYELSNRIIAILRKA
jgi:hypothetical protein